MADARTNREKEGGQALARHERDRGGVQRRQAFGSPTAFDWVDRMSEEMDRVFDRISRDFGFPRRSWLSGGGLLGSPTRERLWAPRVEAFQKADRFIVRAELPGLKKDDVHVELTDDVLTIHGERREEHEEEREGYYHSERQYGRFQRAIPLPEGVIGESAEASFRDGVLEVRMQAAPSEANRGRRLEIKEGSDERERKK